MAPRASLGLLYAARGYKALTKAAGRPSAAIAPGYPAAVSGVPVAFSVWATKSRHSSWFEPTIVGTWLNCPLVSADNIDCVSTKPSMFAKTVLFGPARRIAATDSARRH